jgi:hypothetical protein
MERQEFAARICEFSRELFNDLGSVPLTAAIVATIHPKTQKPLEAPQIMVVAPSQCPQASQAVKDLFAKTLRVAARVTRATAVAVFFEAWSAHIDDYEGCEGQLDLENLPTASEHPARKEIVSVTIEHSGGYDIYQADIQDDDEKRSLAAFEQLPDEPNSRMEGRFSRLLPRNYQN